MSRRRARGDAYGAAQGIPQGTPQDTPGAAPNAIPGAAPRATSVARSGPHARAQPRAQPRAQIEGSLCDHPIRKLFDLCQRQRVTGVLQLVSWGRTGRIELRAGRVTAAAYGTIEGNGAVSELMTLRDGMFELRQELPSVPSGRDAGPAALWAVAEQCRERALSCRIHALSRGRRAVVAYRAGELEYVEIDGAAANLADSANLASALAPFEHGEIQIDALPIALHERVTASIAAPRPDSQPAHHQAPAAPARPPAAPSASPARRPAPARPPATPAHARRAAPVMPARPPAPMAHAQRQVAPPARPSTASGEIAARPVTAGDTRTRPIAINESRGRASTATGEIVAGSVAAGEIVARPPSRPRPPPPPPHVPRRPKPDAVPAGGLRPWIPDPSTAGAAANWREPPSIRRELGLPAFLAVLAVSLLLILGFVALQP
jgi:hypothetical protein